MGRHSRPGTPTRCAPWGQHLGPVERVGDVPCCASCGTEARPTLLPPYVPDNVYPIRFGDDVA